MTRARAKSGLETKSQSDYPSESLRHRETKSLPSTSYTLVRARVRRAQFEAHAEEEVGGLRDAPPDA